MHDPARSVGALTPRSFLKNSWICKSFTCSRKNQTHKLASSIESATSKYSLYNNWNTWWSTLWP